jgi:hypothetical protein
MATIIDFEIDFQFDSCVDHDVFSETNKKKKKAEEPEKTQNNKVNIPVAVPQIIKIEGF